MNYFLKSGKSIENYTEDFCRTAVVYRLLVWGVDDIPGIGANVNKEIVEQVESLTSKIDAELTRNEDKVSIRKALNLKPGVKVEKIEELEESLKSHTNQNFSLHPDFKCLYRIINGQQLTGIWHEILNFFVSNYNPAKGAERRPPPINLPMVTPLFGFIEVYDLVIASYLLEIDTIIRIIGAQTGRAGDDLIARGRIPIGKALQST